MNPQRWQKIEEIFQSALDLAPAERERFVAEQCAGEDAELKDEVEKLLADYDSADSFIEAPVWTRNQFLIPTEVDDGSGESSLEKHFKEILPDPMIGRQIGAYRLAREIGRGGMGAVYMAERADGSFHQKVAVKLIKRGMDTDFILRRFRQERQILASLNHPFIARLLDGGTTTDGLPFFVMEFIEGKPLYRFCDQKKLPIVERLKLFRQICQAIDFAHQNKVIHRDIKPPNILITPNGTPKLLDFGIAKVLDPELSFDTIDPTATAMRLMTPEYASPEQVCGGQITPASDIYSLGVLLYELLTGHRPYSLQNRAPHEIARVICEEEPEPPSTGITREDNLLPAGASEAGTIVDLCRLRGAANVEDLRRELSGDIEKIVLKSLRKEPSERYQTAAEFAQDISNYLQGKPVVAERYFPPASSVKTSPPDDSASEKSLAVLPLKILNAAPNVDTGEEFLSVGLADAIITRLSGVRRLAVRPTSTVLRFGDDGADPLQAGKELAVDFVLDGRIKILGKKIRVSLQLLDVHNSKTVWANQFDETFTDALELEDSISHRIIEAVLPQLTETERRKINKRGTENPKAFDAYLRGRYHWNQFTPESLPKALESFQKAVALDADYALAYVGIADFYLWGNIYGILPAEKCFPPAKEALERALELDGDLGEAYAALGLIASNFFEWNEAERYHRKAIEKNPNYPQAHEWYAALLVGTGRFDEGVAEMLRAEELDALSLRTMTLTAWTLYQARRFDESLAKAEQIIEMDRNYPQGHLQLANNLLELGRYEEAVAAAQKALEMMPQSLLPQYVLCFALARSNRREQARAILQELKRQAATSYVKPYFMAMSYLALGEIDEAFETFETAFAEFDPWLTWFGTEAKLDAVRGDKRFVELFKRTNNPLFKQTRNRQANNANSEKSIAVLPLKLIGASPNDDTGDDDYLRVGLADALITRLSNVRRFVVRPTSSVLPYGKKQINAFDAGRELDVDFIVDGNIRHVGERIRVSAQLLSVSDNSTQWAQTFDEGFVDVLALEDSISEKIVKSLLPHLTGEEEKRLKKRGTDNRDAFEAYLRGRHHWNTFTEDGFAKALIYYNEAIAIAPDYALAYAGIADYFNLLGLYAILPFSETSAAAKEAAQKAITLDTDLAEGYAALGFATLMHDFDWTATEEHLSRAVRLNPNYVTGRIWYAYFLSLKGEYDEALEQIEQALKLDPLTPNVQHARNLTLYYARRFDEAIASTEKLIEKEPQYGLSYLFLSSVMWRVGRANRAVELAQRAIEFLGRTSYTLPWLAAAYAANSQPSEARELLAEIEQLSVRRHASPCLVAMIYCNLNETEKALDLMEKAWEARDGRLLWLGVDPQFDELRDNPRFQKILRLTNNPLVAKNVVEKTNSAAASKAAVRKTADESAKRTAKAVKSTISKSSESEISSVGDLPKSNRNWVKVFAVCAVILLVVSTSVYFFNKYYSPSSSVASPNRVAAEDAQNFIPNKVTPLTSETAAERSPKISPDKSKILFVSNRDGNSEIYLMNADGSGAVRRLTNNQTDEVYANWSPDGKQIVYESSPQLAAESDIWIMDADGGNQRNLTASAGQDARPVFSPDGKKIAFGSNRNLANRRDSNIWTMNADGSNLVQLTDSDVFESDPNYSPDGQKIAYTRAMGGSVFDIWTMNAADGSNQTNLTNTEKSDEALPVYSPSGNTIVFSSNLESLSPRYDLWIMDSNGENRRRVTIHPANDLEAVWLSDTKLIFQSNRETGYKIYQTDINDTEVPGEHHVQESVSIAVLPFSLQNLDERDAPLSLGLAEILTARLGQIKQLIVRPVGSSSKMPVSASEALNTGRDLQVNFVLFTQLQKTNDKYAVEAVLQNTESGATNWSERFSVSASELSDLPNIIAERILNNLSIELSRDQRENLNKKYTGNAEAYQNYLAGRYYLSKRKPDDFKIAIKNFEEATKLDSNFALAYAGLAETYALTHLYQIPPPPDAYPKAKQFAQKALGLDENLPNAHAVLAYVSFHADRDRAVAEREFRRAIEINPSYATAHHWFALALAAMNRTREAVVEAETAERLDGRSMIIKTATGIAHFYNRQYDKALNACDAALAIDNGFVPAYKVKRWVYEAQGNYEAAKNAFLNERSFSGGSSEPGWLIIQAQVEALNDRAKAKEILEKALQTTEVKNSVVAYGYEIALTFNALGERENALAWLEKTEATVNYSFNFLPSDPRFDNLNNEPRFKELLKKLESPPANRSKN
jgi:TolB-like protein/Tol biopolymer transport system component/Tfp pilus assembly protein PilF